VGGVVVLLGLALARQGDRSTEVTAATWPDEERSKRSPPAQAPDASGTRQTSGMKLASICNITM